MYSTRNLVNRCRIGKRFLSRCTARYQSAPANPQNPVAGTTVTTSTSPLPPPPSLSSSPEKLTTPHPEGIEKPPNPKLINIVDQIASLNLLEVSELSGLLKKKLNLPETSFMPAAFGAIPGVGTGAAAKDEEEEATPKKVQTSFKVKLMKFDEKQKVALIKEVKNLLEGMNLVQAKKFVESAPTLVKEDLPKDEAEKLKEALSKVGAVIEIE